MSPKPVNTGSSKQQLRSAIVQTPTICHPTSYAHHPCHHQKQALCLVPTTQTQHHHPPRMSTHYIPPRPNHSPSSNPRPASYIPPPQPVSPSLSTRRARTTHHVGCHPCHGQCTPNRHPYLYLLTAPTARVPVRMTSTLYTQSRGLATRRTSRFDAREPESSELTIPLERSTWIVVPWTAVGGGNGRE